MEKIIKTGLSIFLLLCLADMPYGFYQFVRFIALIGFAALACFAFRQDRKTEAAVFIAMAVLFQPLFKIALGRTLWNIVDVIAAVGLIISLFIKTEKEE